MLRTGRPPPLDLAAYASTSFLALHKPSPAPIQAKNNIQLFLSWIPSNLLLHEGLYNAIQDVPHPKEQLDFFAKVRKGSELNVRKLAA